METIIVLLAIISFSLLVIGIISPEKSLFWLASNRTRLKSTLLYSILFLAFIILGSQLYPVDESKSNEAIPSTDKLKSHNENVIKWLSLDDKKKEKFIKNQIEGTWIQVIQVGSSKENLETQLLVNKNFKTEYKTKGDFVNVEEFIPASGFLDYPQFISKSHTDKGVNEYKTSWLIIKDEVVFDAGTSNQSKEKILYLSNNLFVRKIIEPLTGYEITHYLARMNNEVIADYKSELDGLIYYDVKEGYELIQKGVAIINKSNDLSGYKKIYEGYKRILFVSKLDTSVNLGSDEIFNYVSEGIKDNYSKFTNNYIGTFRSDIENLRKIDVEYVFLDKYSHKIEEMKSLIEIGKAFNQDNTILTQEITLHEKEFNNAYNNYILYGDLTQEYLMELAAESFIKKNAKDPSSIEIISDKTGLIGKTSKGLAYQVVYRGKNSFGALVVNSQKVLLKWDVSNKVYYVAELI